MIDQEKLQAMVSFKKSVFVAAGISCGQLLWAQNAGEHRTGKAFTATGNVGVSANFYSSNETSKTRPAFAWNAYGNMVGKIDKWTLPASFVINHYDNGNALPNLQIGISPTYQWARLHVGDRYVPFSPFTFEGQNFRGVGLELSPKQFRFAAFYGRLNKAVKEDTSVARFRVPQYSRTGYGIKAGIGNALRFFDLIYFHAKDDSSSAASVSGGSRNALLARENAVLGASFKLTLARKWVWTGDAAVSGLADLAGKKSFDSSSKGLKNFIASFLPGKNNVSANYAGQTSVVFYTTNFNSNLGYRRVQPGFVSLGTPYLLDDVESLSWITGFAAAQGKVNVSTNLSQQHNNLSRTLEAELRTQVGNVNVNTLLGQHMNLNLNFSGYNLKQRNDRNSLPDSLRLKDTTLLHQQILQWSVSPSYNVLKGNKIHFINGNFNVQSLRDKNAKTAKQNDGNNVSASLNYTLSLIDKYCSFSLLGFYSRYKQENNSYTSWGPTVGASAQLLKDKSLNLQGNIGYLTNRFSQGTNQKNITYSISSNYRRGKHSFNLFANYVYTPANAINNAINQAIPYSVTTKNAFGGITYSYRL